MQIDPSYQAPRPAWDSPASSLGHAAVRFVSSKDCAAAAHPKPRRRVCSFISRPRRPSTCRPVSSLGRAGARRPLPLCFSMRRRPFASCQSPARTQVAGPVFSGDGPPAPSRVRSREGAVRGDAPGTVAGVKMPPVPSTTEMTVQIFR